MIICAISDLHGNLNFNIDKCDLLLICGDIVPLNIQMNHKKSRKWIVNDFDKWCNSQPCDKVLFIAGNHDMCMENHTVFYEKIFSVSNKVTYLYNSEYVYNNIRIYGTPFCKRFGNWAFNSDKLETIYSSIPKGLDILITHDAPYGTTDVVLQKDNWNTGEHLGNIPLREAIIEKTPKLVFHGHIHSSKREFEQLGESLVTNCSLLDEYYNMIYSPIYYEY